MDIAGQKLSRIFGGVLRKRARPELDDLCDRGYRVLHTASNVLVVLAETGIFTVVTGARPDDELLTTVRQAALDVHACIAAHPDCVGITPIPVVASDHAPRSFLRGVAICPKRLLQDMVAARHPILDAETLDQLEAFLIERLGYRRAGRLGRTA